MDEAAEDADDESRNGWREKNKRAQAISRNETK
jgi:hypothetical protein